MRITMTWVGVGALAVLAGCASPATTTDRANPDAAATAAPAADQTAAPDRSACRRPDEATGTRIGRPLRCDRASSGSPPSAAKPG